jgi:hypothetical protein
VRGAGGSSVTLVERGHTLEKDIPTQKTAQEKNTWLSQQNEHQKRKKGFGLKKSERQGKTYPLTVGHNRLWSFFLWERALLFGAPRQNS